MVQLKAASRTPEPFLSGFEFLTEPLRRFFDERPESFINMLKICNIFAVRFRKEYVNTAKVPWNKPIDISYPFLEACISSTAASDLARTLTISDKTDFGNLTRQNILTPDKDIQHLLAGWKALIVSVWECCSAIPDMPAYLLGCAQVSYKSPQNPIEEQPL